MLSRTAVIVPLTLSLTPLQGKFQIENAFPIPEFPPSSQLRVLTIKKTVSTEHADQLAGAKLLCEWIASRLLRNTAYTRMVAGLEEGQCLFLVDRP